MVQSVYHEETALMPLSAEIYRAMWATLKGIINPVFWKQPTDEDFFFYPFHFEDDANITMWEPFTSQVELVQSISRCLPIGVKLYIKPHPAYMGIDIRVLDLLRLSKLPNVKILHPSIPAISLVKKCVGVITLNSTTGFDTIILNKPVISLGHDFYCHPNLVYIVKEWGELPAIISKVYQTRKPRATPNTIKSFVKNIYKNTILTQGDVAFAEDPLTSEDGEKIAFALDKILRKL
jgi:capsule polysaccharide modification protein KpsS